MNMALRLYSLKAQYFTAFQAKGIINICSSLNADF